MLSLTLAFFFVAMIAAMFGVGGIPRSVEGIAWIGFAFFVVAFLASLIWHVHLGRRPSPPS
ncbi:MAG TPA: DUF1328 domain-containing protein [Planctomycetota bacterium]|nr:DUF1328 domain-containing protein [Planctomycetota bacterium]